MMEWWWGGGEVQVLFGPPAGVDVATHPPPPNVAAPIRCAWYPGRRLDGGRGGAGRVRRGAARRARVQGGGRARRARIYKSKFINNE